MKIKRIGLDLAKNVFQVHGVDVNEKAALKKRLSRAQMHSYFAQLPPTSIGMEACASAHYWARTLQQMGHEVKLIPPQYVKPYVKSNKNDANDAQAICEAMSRPSMRFVAVKSIEQQSVLSLHRVRQRVIRARTALVNEVRGLVSEFGIMITPLGVASVTRNLPRIIEDSENLLCPLMRDVLRGLYDELSLLNARLKTLDTQVNVQAKADERIKRIMQIEGIGPVVASAMVANIGDGKQFKNGRELAAWLGLVPRQHSSGGKERLGGISKRGDTQLRTLLIHGARAVIKNVANKTDPRSVAIQNVIARRNINVATVAVANKNARIIWAMLAKGENYRPISRN